MTVSVIVPVYNAEKYLEECLNSIAAQTFSDFECILVDDGSRDNSPQMCDEWAAKDKRFKVLHKQNEGASLARASGLNMAKGEYILYTDNDDYLLPEMLQTLVSLVKDNGTQAAICSFYRLKDGKDMYAFPEKLPVGNLNKDEVYKKIALALISGLPEDNSFVQTIWRMLFNRAVLAENNINFIKGGIAFPDDLLFAFEYFLCCNCASVIDTPLYVYRWNTVSSVSCSYNPQKWEVTQACYQKIMEKCEQYNLPREEYIQRAASQFLAATSVVVKHDVQYCKRQGYKATIKRIKSVVYDKEVVKLLNEPFVKRMAFQMRLFVFFVKHKMINTLFLSVWTYLKLGMEK